MLNKEQLKEWQSLATLGEWTLVLEAMQIPYKIEQEAGTGRLLLAPENEDAALNEISLYIVENQPQGIKEDVGAVIIPLFVPFILLFWHIYLYQFASTNDWFVQGKVWTQAMQNGKEWWRAVTALTLHADGLHLFSNLLFGSAVASALCGVAGRGLAWLLILLSGVAGNLWNADLHHFSHQSVGASTAVFGSLGILGMVKIFGKGQFNRRNFWVPFAGALALLGLLGAGGARTDVGAHLFGFICGALMGLFVLVPLTYRKKPGKVFQFIMGLSAWSLVIWAWKKAMF